MDTRGLLDLTYSEFPDLSEEERHFIKSVHEGQEDSPAIAGGNKRILRSEVLRWLCTNEEARKLVDPFGIQVNAARITVKLNDQNEIILDFSSLNLPFPLVFKNCEMPPKIRMQGMETTFLSFENSQVGSIEADVMRVKGDLYLRGPQFRSTGALKFPGASVGGDLDCSEGHFQNAATNQPTSADNGVALDADGISVGGDVLLRDAEVKGKISISGADLQGNLDCSDAKLLNPYQVACKASGLALDADRVSVKGSITLGRRPTSVAGAFFAQGDVQLIGADIEGQLNCAGAHLENPKHAADASDRTGDALSADGCTVKGPVFLRRGFRANGVVRFIGASIGGHLDLTGSVLTGVNLTSASVSRSFKWKDTTCVGTPSIILRDFSVGTPEDDLSNWPSTCSLELDGFTYGHIAGGAGDVEQRLAWICRQTKFVPQPYRQLAKILKDEGNEPSSRRVGYEMARNRAKIEKGLIRSGINIITWLTVGYGYYPGLALAWLLDLFLIGFYIYYSAFYAGLVVPTKKEAYQSFTNPATRGSLPSEYERFHASLYSLENSLPVLKFGQADSWQPDPSERSSSSSGPTAVKPWISPSFLQRFRWVQISLGWLFGTMGLGAISGIVRKE